MAGLPNLAESRPAPAARADYVLRINRAIDHVVAHLADPLKLGDVARAAGLSPFHFHRIFQAAMGETVHEFVKRLRLERALGAMAHARSVRGHRARSLTAIALDCGFSSSSDFSRSFKTRFGCAPARFDVAAWQQGRRAQMQERLVPGAEHRLAGLPAGANPDGFEVRLRRVPARRVAFLRVLRPYAGTGVADAARRLVDWARARGLEGGQWLGYQWENPDIVALDDCRYDVGLELAPGTAIDGGPSVAEFPPMTLAEIDIAGPIDIEMRALDWLYKTWLPASGWLPDDQPCFEAWNGMPFAHGFEHFELRVQLPVIEA
jgi:AraC family transcriptional regulator